jgi:hypothetical protein
MYDSFIVWAIRTKPLKPPIPPKIPKTRVTPKPPKTPYIPKTVSFPGGRFIYSTPKNKKYSS